MSKLELLVVLPMIFGQLIRLLPPVARRGPLQKKPLAVLAQLGGLLMVWLGSIKVGQELSTAPLGKGPETLDFVGMLLAVVVIHLAMVAAGHGLGRMAGFSRADRIAVGFAGSQKTLVVGLHVAVTYFGGLAILPMVTYQVAQLLLDAWIADRLREKVDPNSLAS